MVKKTELPSGSGELEETGLLTSPVVMCTDVPYQQFIHIHSLMHGMVENLIRLLINIQLRSSRVKHHRHVINLYKWGSINRHSHHTKFVSSISQWSHDVLQSEKFSAKTADLVVGCHLESHPINAWMSQIKYPVRDRRVVLSPAWSLSTIAYKTTGLTIGSGALEGTVSLTSP